LDAPAQPSTWLRALPRALRGDVVVEVVDPHSGGVQRFGAVPEAGTVAAAGRRVLSAAVDDCQVKISLDSDSAEAEVLCRELMALARERRQLQRDLEEIDPTSVKVLEEASIWDELRQLQKGKTEREVAEIGVRALVTRAGVRRGLFVRWSTELGQCQSLVHVTMDRPGSLPRTVPLPQPVTFVPGFGLVARALYGSGAAVRAAAEGLREVDGPERLAQRELLALPVRFGEEADAHTLGVLLVMDGFTTQAEGSPEREAELEHETKLTDAMALMLGSVLGARQVAEQGKELETAQEIHRQIQTASTVAVPGFDIAGCNRACGTVGGDYFDFVAMPDGRTLAAVMDVSGHNLASGMLMVSARMSLRVLAGSLASPAAIVSKLGEALHEDLTRTERFISSVVVALAPDSPDVEVVNAGHLDTLVRRADGSIEAWASDDVVLGFVAGVRYQGRSLTLRPGDLLLLYTDGLVEATDTGETMFGTERLTEVLRAQGTGSANDAVAAILQAVDTFRGSAQRSDDVTLVAIRATAVEEAP